MGYLFPRRSLAADHARNIAATNTHNSNPTIAVPYSGSRFLPPSVQDVAALAVDRRINEDSSEIGNSLHTGDSTPNNRRSDEPDSFSKLIIISYNAQKSAFNTSVVLETHKHADLILIQECYWGPIKSVTSTSNPLGNVYTNTTSHPQFLCLGAHEHSRVVVYINKKLAHLHPSICKNEISHPDMLLVQLNMDGKAFRILNIYNDCRTHDASRFLVERASQLPPHPHNMWRLQSETSDVGRGHDEITRKRQWRRRRYNICASK